jgi:DNA-binding transcriptional regulator YiaG
MTEEIRNRELSSDIECPNCGAVGIQTRFFNEKFKYGAEGNAVELEARVPFRRCPTCEFEYTDAEAEDLRHEAICRHLKRMIPAEVAGVRKRYDLSRDVFAAKSRLGEASLARWESGQLIQNAAYDNYLFLLTFEDNMRRLEERFISRGIEISAKSAREYDVERRETRYAPTVPARFRALANPDHVQRESFRFHLRRSVRAS